MLKLSLLTKRFTRRPPCDVRWEPTAIIAAIADTSQMIRTAMPSRAFFPTHDSDNVPFCCPLCHHNSVYSRFGWFHFGLWDLQDIGFRIR